MYKRQIKAMLEQYNNERGWFRWLFGNTRGIKELQAFYDNLEQTDHTTLSLQDLGELQALLSNRWNRIQDRKDNYFTAKGHEKLTNQIYKQIAESLSNAYIENDYDYQGSLLAPSILNAKNVSGEPIDQLHITNWFIISENNSLYALDVDKYKDYVDSNHRFDNPHTGNKLSSSILSRLFSHSIWGAAFSHFKNILDYFKSSAQTENLTHKLNEYGIHEQTQEIYHQHHWAELLNSTSRDITYDQIVRLEMWYYPELSSKGLLSFNGNSYYFRLKKIKQRLAAKLNEQTLSTFKDVPLLDIYIADDNTVFRISEFLETFNAENKIIDPTTKLSLSYHQFIRLYNEFRNLPSTAAMEGFREVVTRNGWLYNKQSYDQFIQYSLLKNKTTLDQASQLSDLPKDRVFITSDNYGFDMQELLSAFTYERGLQNPITGVALSADDIERLRSDENLGAEFERVFELYHWLTEQDTSVGKSLKEEPLTNVMCMDEQIIFIEEFLEHYVSLEQCTEMNEENYLLIIKKASELSQQPENNWIHEKLELAQAIELYEKGNLDQLKAKFRMIKLGVKNQKDLLDRDLEDYDSQEHFITSDGYWFDLNLLAMSLDINGFVNPYTQEPFCAADIETLLNHSKHGDLYSSLHQAYLVALRDNIADQYANPSKLINLYQTKSGQLIDIYQTENLMQKLVTEYLADTLDREDLMDITDKLYDRLNQDREIKRGLSYEQETTLSENPIFKGLTHAMTLQNEYTLANISKKDFWLFAERELNEVLTKKGQPKLTEQGHTGMRATCSMFLALRDFDNETATYVRKAGYSETIRHYNTFGSEYVPRMSAIYGQQKGEHALRNIVDTFKGAFLAVLRLDRFSDLFDRMDYSGICVAEKTRGLAGWAGSLEGKRGEVHRSLLELLADYQNEITSDPSSRSMFYQNQSAVDFILSRHRGERFTYKTASGDEAQGVMDRNIIVYYLKTWMGHEGLPDVETPECFKPLESAALAI